MMRARVSYFWPCWWWVLADGSVSPVGYPTAGIAADAARLELEIRAEPDPLLQALLRLGVRLPRRRSDVTLAN